MQRNTDRETSRCSNAANYDAIYLEIYRNKKDGDEDKEASDNSYIHLGKQIHIL